MRWTVVCVVLAMISAACIPRDTSQISLDSEQTINQFGQSWELDYYVNDAYECGLSGNYSFLVMNPNGNPDAEAPLWVYLHGGGQGYWDENGDYQTLSTLDENSWNHQETRQDLIGGIQARVLDGNGQPEDQTLVRRIQEGYRVLMVSYCDHDFYSGLGTPYPNHPTNPDAEVNGLQATMAAIDFTAANYPTTQVWAHGTSAGSVGVWSLASSYGQEGTPLTGVVADSGAVAPGLNDVFDEYLASGDLNYMPTWEPEGLAAKVGFFANESIPSYPEAQIVDRDFRAVPSLFLIGSVDPFCAGDLAPVPEAAPGLTNCEHAYSGLDQAIANQAGSPHEFHFLPNTGHVPTNDPGPANDIVDAFIAEVLAGNPPNFYEPPDLGGPTPDEPFHMPTMLDTSTLDVVVVEDWHVDDVTGTTRQKLIDIHVDDWWEGVEIRVPVRLIAPLEGTVDGFVINGSSIPDNGDSGVTAAAQLALDGGVGVVQTKVKPIQQYPGFPSEATLGARFLEDLDLRYTELYMWGAIMMRSITAAFDDPVFQPGPVIAYGGSKNGITPLISSIHDERVTAVRANVAFTTNTPIRSNDAAAVAEVIAADADFDAAVAAGLPAGDQPWSFYDKAYQSGSIAQAAEAAGFSDAEIQNAIDRVADDIYVSENWDDLAARGVEIFSLPGSHDWVAYDVPGVSTILPDLRTYIVPNGGHSRPGHPEAPSDSVDAAFFAEQLFGADGGLETPDIATSVNGTTLDVTVTFPDGGVPEDSRIFWMYDRGPDGSSWYLYDLFPEDNWATMTGSGSTWTASIPLEAGRASIDLVTTHTVTVDGNVIPISAPYTRVALD